MNSGGVFRDEFVSMHFLQSSVIKCATISTLRESQELSLVLLFVPGCEHRATRGVRHALRVDPVVFSVVASVPRPFPPRTPIAASISVSPAAIAPVLSVSPQVSSVQPLAHRSSQRFQVHKVAIPSSRARVLLVLPTRALFKVRHRRKLAVNRLTLSLIHI